MTDTSNKYRLKQKLRKSSLRLSTRRRKMRDRARDKFNKYVLGEHNATVEILNTVSELINEQINLSEIRHLLQYIIKLTSVNDVLKAKDVRVWEEELDNNGNGTGIFKILYTEPWIEKELWKDLKSVRLDIDKYDYSKPLSEENGLIVVSDTSKLKRVDEVIEKIEQKSFSAFMLKNGRCMIISIGYEKIIPQDLIEVVRERSKAVCSFVKALFKIDNLFEGIRELAIIDPLTHLYNRRYLDELLGIDSEKETETWTEIRKNKKTMVILLADMDNFKSINDNYGHEVGDSVLKRLGQIFNDVVEKYNSISEKPNRKVKIKFYAFRYGIGDELAVIGLLDRKNLDKQFKTYENIDNTMEKENPSEEKRDLSESEKEILKKTAWEIAVEIRERMSEIPQFIKNTMDIEIPHIDISIGISCYDGESNVKHFISSADGRVYRAKKNKEKRKENPKDHKLAIIME